MAKDLSDRFPSLSDVAIAQAWGGWIGVSSDWLAVAGQVGNNIYYSMACNGHGLCQVPYVGKMLADYIVDDEMPEDLAGIWEDVTKYPPSMALVLNPFTLRLAWAVDRINDRFSGSKTLARRRLGRRQHANH